MMVPESRVIIAMPVLAAPALKVIVVTTPVFKMKSTSISIIAREGQVMENKFAVTSVVSVEYHIPARESFGGTHFIQAGTVAVPRSVIRLPGVLSMLAH
jgi:translation elongation factor EF-G